MPDHSYVTKPLDHSQLLGFLLGYFHPDWALDDTSGSEVVSRFLGTATPAEADSLVRDLDEVIADWADQSTRDLVEAHLVNVTVGEPGAYSWLVWLRSALASGGPGPQPLK
jgi:hypothetical protein